MGLVETYRGVAFPWLCDHTGQLNTSKYVEMFDVAGHHLFHIFGLPPANAPSMAGPMCAKRSTTAPKCPWALSC